jgi:crotonobetainyl-CoA:carnitine CoA-transferase CaiB-like acyl-CoA transferase
MAALLHRRRTGRGQFIDVSQTETASSTIPEALLDFAANGRIKPRQGNEDPVMAPHGCYRCQGDERWIVIAVSTDAEWDAFCKVLNRPERLEDKRFRDGLGRWRHRRELDELISQVTPGWDSLELMQALQGAGVPAGAVLDAKDLLFNPHLRARQFYELVSHHPSTGIPPLPYASRPWKLSRTPAAPGKAAPIMGEHNQWALAELLGQSKDEIEALEAAGIIGYAPTDPRGVQRPSLDEQVRQGRLQRYEPDFREQIAREYDTGALPDN